MSKEIKWYRKDWILFQEVASDGGKIPEEMIEVKFKTEDPEKNKHVPFIEEKDNGYLVRTGKNELHAVDKEHKTMFIELVVDGVQMRKTFKIGDKPEWFFESKKGKVVEAYAFCNLHGLWKGTL